MSSFPSHLISLLVVCLLKCVLNLVVISGGHELSSYYSRDGDRGVVRITSDSDSIGSSYDRYVRDTHSLRGGFAFRLYTPRSFPYFRPFVGYKEARLVTKEPKYLRGDPIKLCFVDFASPSHAATSMGALQGTDAPNHHICTSKTQNKCKHDNVTYGRPTFG
ncbi:hypothetical protein F3Y22_tig00113156pilonHSYRG00114 [Hibiscus syriacus]|uniref:Uncharacterized protein n=1 Tax=Hibiscus syriacus TaxID=106335 RepID=A0A6A2WQC5_HIBSY|nr:hypothetical protein F3Y22_tig00113156pilonHSYRG00114 [Hibiscus syriacus]